MAYDILNYGHINVLKKLLNTRIIIYYKIKFNIFILDYFINTNIRSSLNNLLFYDKNIYIFIYEKYINIYIFIYEKYI